jgi:hypothetical protein
VQTNGPYGVSTSFAGMARDVKRFVLGPLGSPNASGQKKSAVTFKVLHPTSQVQQAGFGGAVAHWGCSAGVQGVQPAGVLILFWTTTEKLIGVPTGTIGNVIGSGTLAIVILRRFALQFAGICALAGAASNSVRARTAAVAVTTFPIQVLIEVLRFVFGRFWTRVCVCLTVQPPPVRMSASPLLERCGSRLI